MGIQWTVYSVYYMQCYIKQWEIIWISINIHWCGVVTLQAINEFYWNTSILHWPDRFSSFEATTVRFPETSLIVPDFTISVSSSSCKYLLFCLLLGPLLAHAYFLAFPSCLWDASKHKEKVKEREWGWKIYTYCTWTAIHRYSVSFN